MDVAILAGIAVLLVLIAALAVPMDRLAFLAVCAFTIVVTWNGFRLGSSTVGQGGGGAFSNAFMALALVATIAHVVMNRPSIRVPGWMLVSAGGFVLIAMLNVIFPPDPRWLDQTLLSYRTDFATPVVGFLEPRSNLLMLGRWELAVLVIPIMLTVVGSTVSRVKTLVDAFVVSAVVNATVGILDFGGLHIAPKGGGEGREAGLTLHPNYLSLTCTLGIPLSLYWVSRGGRWRVWGIVATALLLGGAYVSGGRAGALTAPIAVVATVALLPNLRRALPVVLPAAGILTVGLLAFTHAGHQLLQQLRFTGNVATGSDDARKHLAHVALGQFEANPVQGVGLGVIEDAHSIYLQLLAAGGILAMSFYALYIWGLGKVTWRARRGPERDLAVAMAVAIGTWLINGAINAQLADKYLYMIPGLMVALYYTTASTRKVSEPESAVTPRPAARPALDAGAPTPAAAGHPILG